jgi:hypothetical protein
MPMTSVLLTVFEMSVAMAVGFVLGGFVLSRIWQITYLGHRLEEQRDLISVLQRIEAKCSEAAFRGDFGKGPRRWEATRGGCLAIDRWTRGAGSGPGCRSIAESFQKLLLATPWQAKRLRASTHVQADILVMCWTRPRGLELNI